MVFTIAKKKKKKPIEFTFRKFTTWKRPSGHGEGSRALVNVHLVDDYPLVSAIHEADPKSDTMLTKSEFEPPTWKIVTFWVPQDST